MKWFEENSVSLELIENLKLETVAPAEKKGKKFKSTIKALQNRVENNGTDFTENVVMDDE